MTYSSPNADNDFFDDTYTGPSDEEILEQQKEGLLKIWVTCYVLTNRVYGSDHANITELETIKSQFRNGQITAMQAQESCYNMLGQLTSQTSYEVGVGNWSILSQYKVGSRENALSALGVYSYADDTAAIAGGCQSGDVYYNTTAKKLRAVA